MTAEFSTVGLTVYDALYGRKSVRAFLPDPVPRPAIERILAAAARAPSGNNVQPWRVRVLQGAARDRLVAAVLAFRAAHPSQESWGYQYYPSQWRQPYLARRRKVGWDMYGLLGIAKTDTEAMRRQMDLNFRFFDAPVGLLFTVDKHLELGSWIDCGMFVQSVALAAQAEGLGTCLQAAWVAHADIVGQTVGLGEDERLVCGMALGHPDANAPVNRLVTERAALEEFVIFEDA